MIRAVAAATAALLISLSGGSALAGVTLAAPTTGGGFVKPLNGARISQGYGCTPVVIEPVDPACPGGHWHSGVDLAAARGTDVVATLPGLVHVLVSATGYGLHVVIDHGGGLTSLYGHLDTVAVADGTYVTAGEAVGAVGSSGNSTGPHLHFEICRDGIAEDPRLDLRLP